MWNGTMFVDLDLPLNASSLLSASAELLVVVNQKDHENRRIQLLVVVICPKLKQNEKK